MGMFRFVVKVVDTFSRRAHRVRRGLIIKSLRPLRDLLNLELMLHCKKVSTAILNMPNYGKLIFNTYKAKSSSSFGSRMILSYTKPNRFNKLIER